MKITCNREKLLTLFKPSPPSPPREARSPSCKTSSWKPLQIRQRCWQPTWKLASVTKLPASKSMRRERPCCQSTALVPSCAKAADATFRIESDHEGTTIRGERSQFKLPSRKPARLSSRRRIRRSELLRAFGPFVPRVNSPHDFCDRQREQPIRSGRRKIGMERQPTHGRRHRRPPPGENGRPGPSRRATRPVRRRDGRPHACHALAGARPGRRSQRSPDRGSAKRHPREESAGHDLLAAARGPLSALARRFSAAVEFVEARPDGRARCMRRSARRRSSPARKAAASISRSAKARSCCQARRPKLASRESSCRLPTTASQLRSRSTRDS